MKLKRIVGAVLIFIAFFGLAYMAETKAAEFELAGGIYTTHTEEYDTERNEDNNLIALTYRFDDSDWGLLGANFTNSYDIKTNAIAVTYSVIKWRALELELVGGVMKGYTEWELHDKMCPFGEDSDICFLISPKLSLELFSFEGVTPKVSVLMMGDAVIVTAGVSYSF